MPLWRRPDGAIRAPWQVAVFLLVFAGVSALLGGLIYAAIAITPVVEWARLARVPLDQWILLACVFASTHLTARLLRTTDVWTRIRLDQTATGFAGLAIGAGLGIAVIAAPALALVAGGAAHFEASMSDESGIFMVWGALALLVPAALTEELLFRGFAFVAIGEAIGTWRAAIVTSACFGVAHVFNPGATALSVSAVAAAGVFLAAVRIGTGSLWAAFLAHLAVNVTQLVILHAPVSGQAFDRPGYQFTSTGPEWLTGGSWGPEGGLAAVAAMLAVTFLLSKRTANRQLPPTSH